MRRLVVLAALLGAWTSAVHAETPIPPAPERWVTDRAAFLSPVAVAELDGRLGAYAQGTGHQLLVYIDRTTGGVPIEDWSVRAFQRWRVGRRGIDDGLVLFVFADDRRVRIEVGYGLEERVPDALAARIIGERIEPRLRSGDHDGALRDGIAALIATIGGAPAGGAANPPPAPISRWKLIAGVIVAVFFLILLITHPQLAWLMLLSIGSGRGGGGGGWGGGGGFSGGGGRSGGGGASGSW